MVRALSLCGHRLPAIKRQTLEQFGGVTRHGGITRRGKDNINSMFPHYKGILRWCAKGIVIIMNYISRFSVLNYFDVRIYADHFFRSDILSAVLFGYPDIV